MHTLYNLIIHAYDFLIYLASVTGNEKAKKRIEGVDNSFNIISEKLKNSETIWFHCASLGEFEQGRPVIEKIKKKYPQYKLLLTFFSASGYEIRKNYEFADCVAYLPSDTKENAKKLISLLNIKAAFFVKYEFWANYFFELKKNNIPLFIISSYFRKNQLFFKWYGGFYRKLLSIPDIIFVQDETSLSLLNEAKTALVVLSGDTRFDRVYELSRNFSPVEKAEIFSGNSKIIVAGSTWPNDESLLCKFINTYKDIKMIIAPHEISQDRIKQLENKLNVKHIRFSNIGNDTNLEEYRVLIIDNIGTLSRLYKYAYISYVGGGFNNGIHNILEAVAYGAPVIFGPKHHKFNEAQELIVKGGAFSISGYAELENKLLFFLRDPLLKLMASELCKGYVREKKGAVDCIMNHTAPFFD
jgi:3-deoxy-D-manno-octulosonic-acid transferase